MNLLAFDICFYEVNEVRILAVGYYAAHLLQCLLCIFKAHKNCHASTAVGMCGDELHSLFVQLLLQVVIDGVDNLLK